MMISARVRAYINISLHDVSAFEFRCIGIARPEARARTRGTQWYPVTLRRKDNQLFSKLTQGCTLANTLDGNCPRSVQREALVDQGFSVKPRSSRLTPKATTNQTAMAQEPTILERKSCLLRERRSVCTPCLERSGW